MAEKKPRKAWHLPPSSVTLDLKTRIEAYALMEERYVSWVIDKAVKEFLEDERNWYEPIFLTKAPLAKKEKRALQLPPARITEETKTLVEAYADKKDRPVSWVVVKAVEAFLAKEEKRREFMLNIVPPQERRRNRNGKNNRNKSAQCFNYEEIVSIQ